MTGKIPNRRKFLQFAAATAAFGLAGCQVEEGEGFDIDASDSDTDGDETGTDEARTDTDGDETETRDARTGTDGTGTEDDTRAGGNSGDIDEYRAVQTRVGDALYRLALANEALADAKTRVAVQFLGAIATGGIERYSDAPVPQGWDRESIFGASSEVSSALAEAGYRRHAPPSAETLANSVEIFEGLARESERQLEGVRAAAEEIRNYWNEHRALFDPSGDGATTMELHTQFIDREVTLYDSVWVIADAMSPLIGSYSDLHAELQEASDTVTQDCSRQCTEAGVAIVAGKGAISDIYDHAWIRWTTRTQRTCDLLEPEAIESVENWGFTGAQFFGVKSDSGREWRCRTEEWVGTCDDPDFQELQDEVYYDKENQEELRDWGLYYNCADWAVDKLDIVDHDLAVEIYEGATNDEGITRPSDLCVVEIVDG